MQADKVNQEISNINVSLENATKTNVVLCDYNALTNNQKSLVNNSQKLFDSINELSSLQINNVKELINKIGNITLDSGDLLKSARSEYDDLSKDQQHNVDNYNILVSDESTYEDLTISDLINKINAIGDVTLDSKDNIDKLNSIYSALSPDIQQR